MSTRTFGSILFAIYTIVGGVFILFLFVFSDVFTSTFRTMSASSEQLTVLLLGMIGLILFLGLGSIMVIVAEKS